MARLASEIILKDDQLAAIGCVAVEATYLEKHIETLTCKLAGIPKLYGALLTSRLMMDSRIELLGNLAKSRLRSTKARLAFVDIVSELKETNNERNTIIHGVWNYPITGVPLTTEALIKALSETPIATRKSQTLKATEIRKTAERIDAVNVKLGRFEKKYWKHLALRQKSEPAPLPQAPRHPQVAKPKAPPVRRGASRA